MNNKKEYLIIFENTDEERANWWFIWSFIKITFSWWHLINYKIYDSYKIFYDICKKQNKNKKNPFIWCNKSAWSLKNNLKPYTKLFSKTTFINSNWFWFTDLNWKNIVNHFYNAYWIKVNWVIFIKSNILKYLFVNGKKLLRNLEIINYKSLMKYKKFWKITKINNNHIMGNKWIKAKYLWTVYNLLKNKKQIIINFIRNYNEIINNWLIQIYLPDSSIKFQNFLKEDNLNFYKQKWYGYLFFYNIGFNKTSKFIDHIIVVNKTTYVNPKKFKLYNWLNTIKYKNVLNTDPDYYKFLKHNNIPKDSYLWSKLIKYKNLLILPKQCKTIDNLKSTYIVKCNF